MVYLFPPSCTRLGEETQQTLDQLLEIYNQIKTLTTKLVEDATLQTQTSTSANQSILKVAGITSQTSEQAVAVAESLAKLVTFTQNLEKGVN